MRRQRSDADNVGICYRDYAAGVRVVIDDVGRHFHDVRKARPRSRQARFNVPVDLPRLGAQVACADRVPLQIDRRLAGQKDELSALRGNHLGVRRRPAQC
jgi:hypothetical protein